MARFIKMSVKMHIVKKEEMLLYKGQILKEYTISIKNMIRCIVYGKIAKYYNQNGNNTEAFRNDL